MQLLLLEINRKLIFRPGLGNNALDNSTSVIKGVLKQLYIHLRLPSQKWSLTAYLSLEALYNGWTKQFVGLIWSKRFICLQVFTCKADNLWGAQWLKNTYLYTLWPSQLMQFLFTLLVKADSVQGKTICKVIFLTYPFSKESLQFLDVAGWF